MAASHHFKSTIECYDCHRHVRDLKAHRNECPNSRKTISSVFKDPAQKQEKHEKKKYTKDHTDHYFLLDVSGSMSGSRLTKAKDTLSSIVTELAEHDRLAIITFDNHAFFKLKPRAVGQIKRQTELPGILARIFAQGTTALYDAIDLAVTQIRDKEIRTIINVLTDGEDNASKTTLASVEALVAQYPKITLNIIHIGDVPNPPYQQLCIGRGSYFLIQEVEIVIRLRAVFLPSAVGAVVLETPMY